MKKEIFDGHPFLCLYALRNISLGDELRYNYGDKGLHWRKMV